MDVHGIQFVIVLAVLIGLCAMAEPAMSTGRSIERTDLFTSGQDGYHTYRIPALVLTKKGTLLAFCEGRKTSARDDGDIDLLLRRGVDGGRRWQKTQVVHEEGGSAEITIGNPCPVLDQSTGTVHLLFTRNNQRAFHTCSSDDGVTWAQPTELTAALKGFAFRWTRLGTGPGHGLQLQAGPHKGRLLAPVWLNEYKGRNYRSAAIVSDDGGKTWRPGGVVGPAVKNTNECMVVQTADHKLCMNMRAKSSKKRSVAWSGDGGSSWSDPKYVDALIGPTCQASMIGLAGVGGYGPNDVLFVNPASKQRERLTLRLSTDGARTWPVSKVIHAGPSAYADLAVLHDGTIVCLYEGGTHHPYEKLVLSRFPLDWLTGRKAK